MPVGATRVLVYEPDDTTPIDVSNRTASVDVERGRRSGLDPLRAGTATVTLRNDDGAFDPFDTGGSYYTDIRPGAKLVIQAAANPSSPTWRTLFTGRVESWRPGYGHRNRSVIRVDAVDGFAELTSMALPDWAPPQQAAGNRLIAMMALPALAEFTWPQDIDSGATTVGAFPVAAGTSAFTYLQRVVRSEQAQCFMSRAGTFTFRGRYDALAASDLEFRHTATGSATAPKVTVEITGIDARASFEDFANRVVTATEPGGDANNTGEAFVNEDAASVGFHRRAQSLQMTDLVCATDRQADDLGKLILDRYGTGVFRVTSVETQAARFSTAVADKLYQSEIGDLVRVVYRGPSGADYDETLRVVGISHQVTGRNEHRIRWHLSPDVSDTSGLFILGSSSLDGPDVLGY